jgi:conjugative relaxase-like TrwC/TraI family protein
MVTSDYMGVARLATYHSKDNYHQIQLGQYYGLLKDELQLGDLDHASFQNLIRGINPNTGESLVPSKSGQDKQRAAIDITMSAPKSFSCLTELAAAKGDTKLYDSLMQVWDKSVNTTLNHVEKEFSFIRIQKDNKRKITATGNLLITKFQHDTARPVTDRQLKTTFIDPDIHTHNVLMNFSRGPDGKYRALEAKKLLNSNILNGQFLRSELAANLQKDMNINIVVTDPKQGFFEIKGVPTELLQEMSQRDKQIRAKEVELREKFPDMDQTKLHKKAVLASRESKKIIDIDREEIRKNNLTRAEKIVNVDELLQKFQPEQTQKEKKLENTKIQTKEVQTHIAYIIKNSETAVRKLPKYRQNIYSVLGNSTVTLLGQMRASEIFTHVKKSQEDKQQVFNTMHEVLITQLQSTKLDTQKLFASLKNTPNIKIQIEEKFENERARTTSERGRFAQSYSRVADQLTRAKLSNYRDVEHITTTTERDRDRERGAELERDGTFTSRGTTTDNRPVVVTIEDLRRADRLHAELIERERKEQGVER